MSEEAVRQREERLAQMIAKIKERDFRLTPQRMAVLKILAASGQHPSVDEIYREVSEKFPTTSIVRVYKTIALLKELNEVLELGFPAAATAMTATGPTLIPMPSAPSAQR